MKTFNSYFTSTALLKLLRNKYFIATAILVVWMSFLDRNNFVHLFRKSRQLQELKTEKAYYKEKIRETKRARKELMKDSESLERFAREQYFMKKPNEDLYIITNPKQ